MDPGTDAREVAESQQVVGKPAWAGGLWIRRVLVRAQEGQWPVQQGTGHFSYWSRPCQTASMRSKRPLKCLLASALARALIGICWSLADRRKFLDPPGEFPAAQGHYEVAMIRPRSIVRSAGRP